MCVYGGGGKHGPGLSRVGKGSVSLHALRPAATQDFVVCAQAPVDSMLLCGQSKKQKLRGQQPALKQQHSVSHSRLAEHNLWNNAIVPHFGNLWEYVTAEGE